MKNHFWELRMRPFVSYSESKHVGFYKSKKKLDKATKAALQEEDTAGVSNHSVFYPVKHSFED